MNRQLLERPFEASLIRTRKGSFGKQYSYVEGAEYIRRLNESFEGDWSFEVIEHQTLDTEVIVMGKIVAGGVTKMAFGGSSVTVNREGEIISIADDLKAAATDALKKASSLLGVGLHLYSEPTTTPGRNGRPSPSPHGNGNNGGNGNGKPAANNGNGKDRLTQKQLSCIWGMARSLGRSVEEVRQHTLDAYGAQPEQMNKTAASNLITELGEALSQIGGAA